MCSVILPILTLAVAKDFTTRDWLCNGSSATSTSSEAILLPSHSLDGPQEEPGKREQLYLSLPRVLCVTNQLPRSVDNFITTQPADSAFRAAILQSGQAAVYDKVTNGTVAWDALAKQLNCSTQANVLKCVRAAKANTILSIIEHSNLNFSPVKDNITELQDPEAARKAGNVARVPILTGSTAQEGSVIGERRFSFSPFQLPPLFVSSKYLTVLSPIRIRPKQHYRFFNGSAGQSHRLDQSRRARILPQLHRQRLAHLRRLSPDISDIYRCRLSVSTVHCSQRLSQCRHSNLAIPVQRHLRGHHALAKVGCLSPF
jgi:hypothetical protein